MMSTLQVIKKIGMLSVSVLLLCAVVFAFKSNLTAKGDEEEEGTETADVFEPEEDGVKKHNLEKYMNRHYETTPDTSQDVNGKIRIQPGSKDEDGKEVPIVTTSDGKKVNLVKEQKIYVWGEAYDKDGDNWYWITTKVNGEWITGYIYQKKLKKDFVEVAPTPVPTATPTPEPTMEPTPEITGEDSPFEEPSPTIAESTQKMLDEEKKTLGPIRYLLILILAVVIGFTAYIVISRIAERRIEKEMNLEMNKDDSIERLEGESEEDYQIARKEAMRRHLKEHEQSAPKQELEPIVEEEEFKLDLEGIFDDDSDTRNAVSEAVTEAVEEDTRNNYEQYAASTSQSNGWNAEDEEFIRHLTENADAQERELIQQIVPNYAQNVASEEDNEKLFEDEAETPESILRAKLDALKEQDTLVHLLYGVGEVIDNSDAEIIQVRFNRDLRFLRKEKLVRKHLVEL